MSESERKRKEQNWSGKDDTCNVMFYGRRVAIVIGVPSGVLGL